MQGNRPCGDGKPQPLPADGPVACHIHAVERLEDEREILRRNAGTVVVDDHFHTLFAVSKTFRTTSGDAYLCARRTVANRVTDDVFKRAAQQFRITRHLERRIRLHADDAPLRIRLDSHVIDDVLQQVADVELLVIEGP